jgi:dipeptidyl aminopeptidase/acylaminoacyl peptidase
VKPIAAERCVASRELTEPRLAPDGRHLLYVRSTPAGAVLVVHSLTEGHLRTLGEVPGVRAGRGMGGGAWCFTADGGRVVLVGSDGNLWSQSIDGGHARQLTDIGPDRGASAPVASPDGRLVAFTVDTAEVHVLDLAASRTRRVDDGGDDFVLDPSWTNDGWLRWVAWNVPDMPWDRTGERGWHPSGERLHNEHVAAMHQLRGEWCVYDQLGFVNVWRHGGPFLDEPFEHAGPTWGPGARSYAPSPNGRRLAFTRNEHGFGRLVVFDTTSGEVEETARGVHGQLSWVGDRLAALRTGARTPTQVVVYDTTSWERTVVAVGPEGEWADDELVEPELVEVPTGVGDSVDGVVHARLYRAAGDAGRVIVWLHGGPTDQWQVTWMPRIAFWRSRGWHVLVPDHRGSTGHGRAYQQALRGRWGELDVADVIAATEWAQREGLALASGTVVMGGSAGGFTALGAVARAPERFAAAVVLYPVTDLADMAERSHRFERHYTDTLVGPLPEFAEVMRDRSPFSYAHLLTATPLLVLHGEVDPVVPVDQSRVLAERVRAAGGVAELHVYPGEGHGFRQRDHQLDEFHRIEGFLSRHVRVASSS